MMAPAAAAVFSSRAVSGLSTTKGLFLIFTLLCLVCFSSSLIDKDQLEKLKEEYQKARANLDKLKATYKSEMSGTAGMIDSYMRFFNPFAEILKKSAEEASDDDVPPVHNLLDTTKVFMEKTKAYVSEKDEEFAEKIEDMEKKLKTTAKLIQFLEEQQAEL